ncbi:hypothetical protein RRG08_020499 [Elysia crispata]|uniref:Uncharacterized protein n=1 Tax=Elysia crispata TaxID=231223 RepID=A0AAE1DFU4_9GAST|nr:hypothetical protein RRG08_020499 [Elysia crispata]
MFNLAADSYKSREKKLFPGPSRSNQGQTTLTTRCLLLQMKGQTWVMLGSRYLCPDDHRTLSWPNFDDLARLRISLEPRK